MLNHEDHGMMTNFEVVPPGQGDALPIPAVPALPPAGGAPDDSITTLINGRPVKVPLGDLAGPSRAQVEDVLAQIASRPGCAADPVRAYRAATGQAPPTSAPGGNGAPDLYCKV